MSSHRIFPLLGSLVFFSATAVAADGTEDRPELMDPEADVEYYAGYVGPQNHDYLDVLAGWFAYENETDSLLLTFKLRDATRLSEQTNDWYLSCIFYADVTAAGEARGFINATWKKDPGAPLTGGVSFRHADRDFAAVHLTGEVFATFTAPGYVLFRVPRTELLQFGDELGNLAGSCAEVYAPAGAIPILTANNIDRADSDGAYSIAELRRTRFANGTADEAPTPTIPENGPTQTDEAGATSGPTWLVVAVTFIIAAAWRRQRQPS